MGSLIPVRMKNLLPSGKNLGVTHITNGCYRLHPIEWNVGEAAGLLATHCLKEKSSPKAVYQDSAKQQDFRAFIHYQQGIQLEWPRIFSRSDFNPVFSV